MSKPSEQDHRPLTEIMADHAPDATPQHLMEHAQEASRGQLRQELTEKFSKCGQLQYIHALHDLTMAMATAEPRVSAPTLNEAAGAFEFTATLDPLGLINVLIRSAGQQLPDDAYLSDFREHALSNGQFRGILVTQLPSGEENRNGVSILGIDHVVDLMIKHQIAVSVQTFTTWKPSETER